MVMGVFKNFGIVIKGNQMVAINLLEYEIIVGDTSAVIHEIDSRYREVRPSTLTSIQFSEKPKMLVV